MRFKNKVVVVTGSGRNIGREICLAFARESANVVVNVRSNKSEGQSIVDKIKDLQTDAMLVVGDVSQKSDVVRMFGEIKNTYNTIDVLVNNASIRPHSSFLDTSDREWNEVFGVTLNAAFYCSKEVVPLMIKQGSGSIINISGLTGFMGQKERVHVVAAKMGLHGFTKALAHELGEFGIRVNTVVPGMVDTKRLQKHYPCFSSDRKLYLQLTPLKRLAGTNDIANACTFLASPEAAYITGHALHVNGGRYMV